jgi:predicted  nucleic acid-binding Zn-ribbon protein
MATSRALALRRLHNRLRNLTDWPRELQLAAVEDALSLVLPPESARLAAYRKLAAELVNQERVGAMQRDVGRLRKIEAQVDKLVETTEADDPPPIPGRRPARPRSAEAEAEAAPAEAARSGAARPLWLLALAGPLLLGAGWAGATYYYDVRIATQVQDQLQRQTERLDQVVAEVADGLAARAETVQQLDEAVTAAQRDLAAHSASFDARVAEALAKLPRSGGVAAAGAPADGAAAAALAGVQARLDALQESLAMAEQAMAPASDRVTGLVAQIEALGGRLAEAEAQLERGSAALAGLDERLPALLAKLDDDPALDQKVATLDELDEKIATLTQTIGSSHAEAADVQRQLDAGRAKVARWEAMDQELSQRQSELLGNLDRYAESLEGRVREFMQILDQGAALNGG